MAQERSEFESLQKIQKEGLINLVTSWEKQMDIAAAAAGHTSEDIQASICLLCGDEPESTEQYIQACERNWENCEAVIAHLGEQLSK